MAKEFIERGALIARYDAEHVGPPGRARELMATAPAVDVVEVVRCRDCKHSYRIDGAKEEYDCAKISAFAKFFPGDHFCGYGERKTDG